MKLKFTQISIPIAYRTAGNVITNKNVSFQVLHEDNQYTVKPLLNRVERRLTTLPKQLYFKLNNNTVLSSRGIQECNSDVLDDIVKTLRAQNFI